MNMKWVEDAKDREYLTTSQITKKYTDDLDGKEKTEVRDVKLDDIKSI